MRDPQHSLMEEDVPRGVTPKVRSAGINALHTRAHATPLVQSEQWNWRRSGTALSGVSAGQSAAAESSALCSALPLARNYASMSVLGPTGADKHLK